MKATPGIPNGTPLSKEEINDLPMLAYEGEVLLVQTEGELGRALARLKGRNAAGL